MQLEDSNGKIIQQATLEDVAGMIAQVGNQIDHCILSDGERYIQTAGKQSSLTVEYRDESGHYEVGNPQTAEIVQRVFAAYFQNDANWKSMIPFARIGGGIGSTGGYTGQSQGLGQNQGMGGSQTVLDAFARKIKQKANSALGRGLRDILRKLK